MTDDLSEYDLALATKPAPADCADDAETWRAVREAFSTVLDELLSAGDTLAIGRRCTLLAYELKAPSAPRTQKELAAKLRVTESAISQALKSLREESSLFTR